jgi:hypothetical protein
VHKGQKLADIIRAARKRPCSEDLFSRGYPNTAVLHDARVSTASGVYRQAVEQHTHAAPLFRRSRRLGRGLFPKIIPIAALKRRLGFLSRGKALVFGLRKALYLSPGFFPRGVDARFKTFPNDVKSRRLRHGVYRANRLRL